MIIILQEPETRTPAVAYNIVTLTNIISEPTAVKYILQITKPTGEIISDIRQTPNAEGVAIFDIQNILKSIVGTVPQATPELGFIADGLQPALTESTPFLIKAGYESAAGVPTIQATTGLIVGFNATVKDWTRAQDINPVLNPFPSEIGSDNICTDIQVIGGALTDRPTKVITSLVGVPTGLQIGDEYLEYNIPYDLREYITVTYQQDAITPLPGIPQGVKGIEAFRVYPYDNNVLGTVETVQNIISEGGGPNVNPGDSLDVVWPYNAITIGVGNNNVIGYGVYPGDYTHYWILPQAWDPCSENLVQLTDKPAFTPVRVNLTELDCMDYPHVQLMWMNSYGFLDYFTFTKRREKIVNVQRNEYLEEKIDYNAATAQRGFRGNRVFSQQVTPTISLTTDWLSDVEAEYLENLFKSPDVRANGDGFGPFQPVVLVSNTYTEKTYRKDKLFQYEVVLKLDNLKTQRG